MRAKKILNLDLLTHIKDNLYSNLSSRKFDDHWDNNEVVISPLKLDTSAYFLDPIINKLKSGPFKILDIGCGDGVHLNYFSKHIDINNHTIVAIDISLNVLKRIAQVYESITFLHADANDLPIREATFDIVYSYGVLAYTNSLQKGIEEAVRVLKSGGFIGLYVLTQENGLLKRLFSFTRNVTKSLPLFFQHRIADCIVPFLSILPTSSNLSLKNATWRQCREIVLVNIAPQKLVIPTREELLKLCKNLDLEIIDILSENPTIIWLSKK